MDTFFSNESWKEGFGDTEKTLKNVSPHVTMAAALAVHLMATTMVPTGCWCGAREQTASVLQQMMLSSRALSSVAAMWELSGERAMQFAWSNAILIALSLRWRSPLGEYAISCQRLMVRS